MLSLFRDGVLDSLQRSLFLFCLHENSISAAANAEDPPNLTDQQHPLIHNNIFLDNKISYLTVPYDTTQVPVASK